ncbi:uncharacterized protein IUM83_01928 [Phytophthora cinnamomi]|uniref:uncharacterized protein n=1 Tax=Phytophthora cinnamomi TaxID=4785 RepID=UPI00355A2859|nr:hypothetical protein IUM83_01928 [Phytophthora cinnamomi]
MSTSISAERQDVNNELPVLTAARVVSRECVAIGGGVLKYVEKRIDGFLDSFSTQENALLDACSRGASERALEYVYGRSLRGAQKLAVHVAAMAGHIHVLQWLVQHNPADFSNLRAGCLSPIDRAAQHGHLDAVVWLFANCVEGYSPTTFTLAAQCGHVSVLRWLHRYGSEPCTSEAMVGAAARNKLRVVKWLHRHGRRDDAHTAILKAAEHGHLPVVAWLYLHGSEADALQAMLVAASSGQLSVVKWLHENARELAYDDEHSHNFHTAVQLAARGGHDQVAVWLLRRPQRAQQGRRNKRTRDRNERDKSKRARLE